MSRGGNVLDSWNLPLNLDFESMRKDAYDFAKDRFFSGYWDNRSVQENFDLITSFIRLLISISPLKPEGRYLRYLG